METLTYLQIFAAFWCSVLLTFTPGLIKYRQFALVVAIISTIVILFNVCIKRRMKIPKPTFVTFSIYFIIIAFYRLTPTFYNGQESNLYTSYFLALAGQIFPAALTATLIVDNETVQNRIKRFVPLISLIFCLLSLYAVLFPTASTSGGLTDNENGLDYQSAAYLAAYASGLAECYLVSQKKQSDNRVFSEKIVTLVMIISIFLDFIAMLVSGGRGGFVTFGLMLAFSLYIALSNERISSQTFQRIIIILFILLVAGYFGIRYVSHMNISTSGFNRILNFIKYGGTAVAGDNRYKYQDIAFAAFKKNPILGNGVGSIFFELGRYSHNCFTDALAETGIVGVLIFTTLIVKTIIYGLKFIKLNATDSLWLYLFFCGFIMSLFSGYYLTHIPMYWAIVFIQSKHWLLKKDSPVQVKGYTAE